MLNYSVLMTVYKKDSPENLIKSISSMLNQTLKTNDFVLVCDGEITKELEEAIHTSFKGNEHILNLIRLPKNVGLGRALRFSLPLCKNVWVARMDDDDISHSDRCEKEISYIMKHPNVSILGSYVNEFDDNPEEIIRVKKVPTKHKDILAFSKRRNPFNHSTLMINRDKIIGIGNYSPMRTNQDVDTWVRALNKGLIGANLNEALVDFRFDVKTYQRRKDWKNVKLMIQVWKRFRTQGYCSWNDYMFVVLLQIYMFIMPERIVEWTYNHLR